VQALVKSKAAAGLWLEDVPAPEIGINDVLIRVCKTGICGTDLHIYDWDAWAQRTIPVPMVVGHEFVGEIVDLGSNVSDFQVGDLVSGEGHVVCGRCRNCMAGRRHLCAHAIGLGVQRPGAFAEYISIPEQNAWLTDRRFPPEIATIQEPMGNAVHAASVAPLAGAAVAIFGAGPIGLFAVPIARATGAAKIMTVEPSNYRRELAQTMGSDVVIDPRREDVLRRILDETGGEGADVLLEMSGNPQAIAQGLRSLRSGGHVSLLGIPSRPMEVDLADGIIFKGATVRGIAGRRIWETWYQTRGFLESGMDLSPIITHELPLSGFAEAFDLVASGQSGKVMLRPAHA